MIDLTTLKEELGVANTSAAKIVGGGMNTLAAGSTSVSITLSTSDWNYLEIVSYPIGTVQVYYSNSNVMSASAASFASRALAASRSS